MSFSEMRSIMGCRSSLGLDAPKVMGILNATPDSFSDGGKYDKLESAVAHAFSMEDDGADIIDVGAESTRPGFVPISASEELNRLIPVLENIVPNISLPISVDTSKTAVAEAAIDAGADIINDVNAGRDPGMLELISSSGVYLVIMHSNGSPDNQSPFEGDLFENMISFFDERIDAALDAGIRKDRIIIDPGIGFGKSPEQNMEIVNNPMFYGREFPVLIGASRKRFLSVMYPGEDRDVATITASVSSVMKGADIVRVHNVKDMVSALRGLPCKQGKV